MLELCTGKGMVVHEGVLLMGVHEGQRVRRVRVHGSDVRRVKRVTCPCI